MDPNRTRSLPASSSSQKSPNFSRNPSNLSPPKDKKAPPSSPYQRSDADSHLMNVGLSFHQPGMTSDKNLPFTPSKLTGPPLPIQRGNVMSEDRSQFGSSTVHSDHLSGPPQHHQGTRRQPHFGTTPTHKGSASNLSNRHCGPSHDNITAGAASNLTTSTMDQPQANSVKNILNTIGRMSGNAQKRKLLHDGLSLASSAPSRSSKNMEPVYGPMQVTPVEQQTVRYSGNKSPPLDTDGFAELNQHRRKRKKAASDENKEGRSCNCLKCQCLQRHCACFASKTLCSYSCTCQDCRNTSDHMSRVQSARKKIEARYPHAFAPKITDEGTGTKSSANAMEDGPVSSQAQQGTKHAAVARSHNE